MGINHVFFIQQPEKGKGGQRTSKTKQKNMWIPRETDVAKNTKMFVQLPIEQLNLLSHLSYWQ